MRNLIPLLFLCLLSSCSKNINCTALDGCLEHNGEAIIITKINHLSNISGDTSIMDTRIDTVIINLNMQCGRFALEGREFAEGGKYEIINDELIFKFNKEPCSKNVECLTAFHHNKYKWSCQVDRTELTLFEEWISIHEEGSLVGTYSATQIFRQIIY